jgi:hypothetical protein
MSGHDMYVDVSLARVLAVPFFPVVPWFRPWASWELQRRMHMPRLLFGPRGFIGDGTCELSVAVQI